MWTNWHPFIDWSMSTLGWTLTVFVILTIVCFVVLESMARRLITAAAPMGIVSFELAATAEESREIVASWDEGTREIARQNLWWDYLFIPLYTTTLAILGIMSAHWFTSRGLHGLSNLAILLAWGQWLAGLLDFAENSALLRALELYPEIPEGLPRLSSTCARCKFVLVVLAAVCCFFGLMLSLSS